MNTVATFSSGQNPVLCVLRAALTDARCLPYHGRGHVGAALTGSSPHGQAILHIRERTSALPEKTALIQHQKALVPAGSMDDKCMLTQRQRTLESCW